MAEAPPPQRRSTASTIDQRLHLVRTCGTAKLKELCRHHFGADYARLPTSYIDSLCSGDQITALRACLMCWTVTEEHILPREMQLREVLADRRGLNTVVSAGTGSGKTLPIALNILLDDPDENTISITVSPLKRLQTTQTDGFNDKLRVRSLAINEDTPRDPSWWSTNVWSPEGVEAPVRHLIVTVEQLFKSPEGHMPRLGEWLRSKPAFQKLVRRINVDEAHFIFTAGESLYGLPAFRPAWGLLDHLKRQLPNRIRWHFFSATFPKHILSHIESKFLPGGDHVLIHLTSNRPNIMYATHRVEGQIDNVLNYRCFMPSPYALEAQPRTIIFVDDKKLAARIQKYLRGCLPPSIQPQGIVRHYHSSMSQLYLEQTHEAFVSPSGTCRILIATSGQSVGVDFPNVKIVCTVGLPSTIVDALQRGGRANRTAQDPALFTVFYDPWVLDIDPAEYDKNAQTFFQDPDRPRDELRSAAQRRERAPLSLVNLVQSSTCLRSQFAQYLNDSTPEALLYSTMFCCERHTDGFKLNDHLPSPVYVATSSGTKRKDPASTTKNKYRLKSDRIKVEELIIEWLHLELLNDKLFRSSSDILSIEKRKELAHIPPQELTCSLDITRRLDETVKWGEEFAGQLFELIHNHDEANEERERTKALEKQKISTTNRSTGQVRRRQAAAGGFIVTTADDYTNASTSKKPKL